MLSTNRVGILSTGMLSATLLMITMLLGGCSKIVDIFSSENSFLSSMNGRWSDKNNNGVMFNAHGGMLVGIDTANAVIVIQPKGKLDADNHMLPVKMTIISPFTTEGDVYLGVAKFLCPSLAPLLIPENGIMALAGAGNCIQGFTDAQGLPKLAAAKASIKEGMVFENVILYNASQKKDEVRLGVKSDNGTIIFDLDFVRKLTDEEQKQLETAAQNPHQKFAASDSFIDKTVDELIVKLAKSEAEEKAKAADLALKEQQRAEELQKQIQEAEQRKQIEEQMRQDRVGSYFVQVGAHSNPDTAAEVLDKLKNWGFKAYTEKAGDKIRVRAGPYTEKDQAEEARQLLEKRGVHGVVGISS